VKFFSAPNFENSDFGFPFPKEILNTFKEIGARTRCKNIAYWARITVGTVARDEIANTYPAEWLTRYSAQLYEMVDPVVTVGLNSVGIIVTDFHDQKNPATRDFFADTLAHDIGVQSISVPFHPSNTIRTVTTFTFDELPDNAASVSPSLIVECREAASIIAKAMLPDDISQPIGLRLLTDRETQVMRQLADGKTYIVAGETLGISKWTIVAHVQSVKAKLGTHHLSETVAKCVALGLLT
jgi:DNA-binding CsgD family transcriptional regulator